MPRKSPVDDTSSPLLAGRMTQLNTPQWRTKTTASGPSSRQLEWRQQILAGHQVVHYIVQEMKTNAASQQVAEIHGLLNNPSSPVAELLLGPAARIAPDAEACHRWAELVAPGHVWDHKPYIQHHWKVYQVIDFAEIGMHDWEPFYYSIWSNIHYGYVG